MPRIPLPQMPGPARFLQGVVGLVFGGIGVTVLGFMWLTPSNDFGAPPLFFRVFASFIALAFVAFGGTMAFTAFRHGGMGEINLPNVPGAAGAPSTTTAAGYVCPNCGAALGEKADVSPMGDVKCSFCGRWFNVHGRNG